MKTSEPTVELISSSTCPFAQRSRMVLLTKGVSFAFTEISLDDKPDWFLNISPYAKVPVLRHRESVLYESSVINEYLEEVFPDPPLLPQDPGAVPWRASGLPSPMTAWCRMSTR